MVERIQEFLVFLVQHLDFEEIQESLAFLEKHLDLDKYEQDRQPRRSRKDLKLSLVQRHEILVKERGYTVEEVKGAWKESLEIRQKRMETLAQSSTQRQWEEFCESFLRLYNRLFRCMVWV